MTDIQAQKSEQAYVILVKHTPDMDHDEISKRLSQAVVSYGNNRMSILFAPKDVINYTLMAVGSIYAVDGESFQAELDKRLQLFRDAGSDVRRGIIAVKDVTTYSDSGQLEDRVRAVAHALLMHQ